MIAVDWSHTKGLATFDGRQQKVEDRKTLLKRVVETKGLVVLEQSCPLSLVYDLLKVGAQVHTIPNWAVHDYRVEHDIKKSDEVDARLIYHLCQNGIKPTELSLTDSQLQVYTLYGQYRRYQKARVAMMNMQKAYKRHFGDSESKLMLLPNPREQLSPYDISIQALQEAERNCLKQLVKIVSGESASTEKSTIILQPPTIRGLGSRIWIGLIVTANPKNFKCLSAYLRFCGLTEHAIKSCRYNRHARMLYHMLAEETIKLKDPAFRAIYDKCKVDVANKHSEYTKGHIHSAALNRTATFLAKRVFNHCNGREGC